MSSEVAKIDWDKMKPNDKRNHLEAVLTQASPQMQKLFPANMDVKYFITSVLFHIHKHPDLLECTRSSLYGSILQCGQLGLQPDSIFGEAHLIAYNRKIKGKDGAADKWIKECQMQIGYKGLKKLAMNTNEYSEIYAIAVYKGDYFNESLGTNKSISHTRAEEDDERPYDDPTWVYENLTHVYAVVNYRDERKPEFVSMKKKQVEARRKRSQSQLIKEGANKVPSKKPIGAWFTDYEKMACKTVIRELAGGLQSSTQDHRLMQAAKLDEQYDLLGQSQHNSALLLQNKDVLPESELLDIQSEVEMEQEADETQELDIAQQVTAQVAQTKGANAIDNALKTAANKGKKEEAQAKAEEKWGSYTYEVVNDCVVTDTDGDQVQVYIGQECTPSAVENVFKFENFTALEKNIQNKNFKKIPYQAEA